MKSFLRWVGGKRKHIAQIRKLMPENYNVYYEPFVGGGSILFDLKPKVAVINDINSELMTTFKVMRDEKQFPQLVQMLETYQQIKSKEMFYKIRAMDREENWSEATDFSVALRFLFLNRTNYRGVYRCNPKGYNNTPADWYRLTEKFDVVNKKELEHAHKYLSENSVQIDCTGDYASILENANAGDFVLIDPPYDYYDEETDWNNVYYGNIDFTKDDQIALAEVVYQLTAKGVKVMVFNFNTPLIMELYGDFNIHQPEKKLTMKLEHKHEIIITNY